MRDIAVCCCDKKADIVSEEQLVEGYERVWRNESVGCVSRFLFYFLVAIVIRLTIERCL